MPSSDVDVAVVLRREARIDAGEALFLRSEYAGDLEALLGCRVDVVDLDRCSPPFAFALLNSSLILADNDPDSRRRAELRQISLYQDLSETRVRYLKHLPEVFRR